MIGIKDMEMPASCEECRFYHGGLDWCYALQALPTPDKECPLVELPEPYKEGE